MLDRFWAKVDKTGDCWIWTACVTSSGYGSFGVRVEGRVRIVSTHRFSYEIHKGPIPEGMCVMHSCDNRRCVRPEHLSVGTITDNNRDMTAKGRRRGPVGEEHPDAKMTEAKVRAMRSEHPAATVAELARKYGIGASTAHRIIRRQSWRHV